MTEMRLSPWIGVSLLAAGVIYAGIWVTGRWWRASPRGTEALTIAHYNLDTGFRTGFAALVADYERLHPGVKVEVLEVPPKVWVNWLVTKLVGENAPDLMQLGSPDPTLPMAAMERLLVREFSPLREPLREPNPYNTGSPLEHTPWRQTFYDGLSWPPSYSLTNFEVFGIPLSVTTTRMIYNADLLRSISGDEEPPRTFDEFLQLCEAAEAYAREHGRTLVPIAAGAGDGIRLLDYYFGVIMQQLSLRLDRNRQFILYPLDYPRTYLEGSWSLKTPEVRAGLQLMRRVGLYFTPGFLQLERDTALFYFAQERALMMPASSQDLATIRDQVGFRLGIFRLPLLDLDDPEYGRFLFGASEEVQGSLAASFGVTERSPRRELAIDFLRFVTAQPQMETFSRLSGWLPSIIGAKVPADLEPFHPVDEGYPRGFRLLGQRAEMDRPVRMHLHELLARQGSVDAFIARVKPELDRGMQEGLERFVQDQLRSLRRRDPPLGAYFWLGTFGPEADRVYHQERLELVFDSESQLDAHLYLIEGSEANDYVRGEGPDVPSAQDRP